MSYMKKEIEKAIKDAILSLQKDKIWPTFDIPKIKMDYPQSEKFGDYATNIAMILAQTLKKKPLEVAKQITKLLNGQMTGLEKTRAVSPGYINFYMAKKYFQDKLAEINKLGEKFGNSNTGKGKKINIEFISSNPTGPIHLGNARGGPLGDALGNIFEKTGYEVEREYYVNDFGNQVEILGHSILKDEEAQYKGS